MNKRLLHLIELTVGFILAVTLLVGALIFLTKKYQIKIPENILQTLAKNNIVIKHDPFETRLLPYPHIYSRSFEMKIEPGLTLTITHFRLRPDLWALIFSREKKIAHIGLEDSLLQVHYIPLAERPENLPGYKFDLNKLMSDIRLFITVITEKLSLPDTAEIAAFRLIVEEIDPKNELLIVRDFTGRNRNNALTFRGSVYMGEWMDVSANVKLWLRPDEKLRAAPGKFSVIERADLHADGKFDLGKLPRQLHGMPDLVQGKATTHHYATFSIPLKKIFHTHNLNFESFTLGEPHARLANFYKSHKLKLIASGFADIGRIELDKAHISIKGRKYAAGFRWIYEQYKLEMFLKDAVPFLELQSIIGNAYDPFVHKIVQTSTGTLSPAVMTLDPWHAKTWYKTGFSFKPQKIHDSLPENKNLIVRGEIEGTDTYAAFNNLRLFSENSFVRFGNTKTWFFNGNFQLAPHGTLFLGDLYPGVSGIAQIDSRFYCNFVREPVCKNSYFSVENEGGIISQNAVSSLTKKFFPNNFPRLQPFAEKRNVTVHKLQMSGNIEQSRLLLMPSVFNTSYANFLVSGSYLLNSKSGKLKLEIGPPDQLGSKKPDSGLVFTADQALAQKAIVYLAARDGRLYLDTLSLGGVKPSKSSESRDK